MPVRVLCGGGSRRPRETESAVHASHAVWVRVRGVGGGGGGGAPHPPPLPCLTAGPHRWRPVGVQWPPAAAAPPPPPLPAPLRGCRHSPHGCHSPPRGPSPSQCPVALYRRCPHAIGARAVRRRSISCAWCTGQPVNKYPPVVQGLR